MDSNKTLELAGSLDNLHDIITPEPFGLLPLAPGWYIAALLLVTLGLHLFIIFNKAKKANRYKSEALKELAGLSAKELVVLSKKVGLHAYGRERVAKLSGDKWWDFVEQNSRAKVHHELRAEIAQILYRDQQKMSPKSQEILPDIVRIWITTHRVEAK